MCWSQILWNSSQIHMSMPSSASCSVVLHPLHSKLFQILFFSLSCHNIFCRLPHRQQNANFKWISVHSLNHFQSTFRSTTGSGWSQSSVISCDRDCWQCGFRFINESRPAWLCSEFFRPGGPAKQEAQTCRLLLSKLQGWRGKVPTNYSTDHSTSVHNWGLTFDNLGE